ncbi:nitrate/nitrite transporter NarK [Stackebrandtia endophytica]|uniref:Nitrate/nitrite transporter NarK n=1 Tax=Stackebrandtia endophytica TaxID=1496996 RepID=A0A543AY67_9ACTN|nr:MFS transporter [Stackebrandtia endophytica]TQL77519.1 nitrate/nitrite transporter NarK [Stackebrandtia endophytica]
MPTGTGLSRARLAVTLAFIAHGMVFASWLPRIPALKNDLGLSDGALGLILLAPPAGAIAAMSVTGAACARFGTATVTRVTAIGYTLGLTAIGWGATSTPTLVAALLLAGALVGAFDVAMNSQAATVERAMSKPVMGSFHASWSLASAAGAGIGGVAAQYDVALWIQLLCVGGFALLLVLPFFGALIPDAEPEVTKRRWRFERGLMLLAVVAFAALLAEGAAADWSAVFLSEDQAASAMVAAWGYSLFSVAMFLGRLAGDRLVHRIGRSRSISSAAVVGGIGMAAGLIIAEIAGPGPTGQAAVIAGLFILGLGIAVIVPVVFSAAGDGPGIAMVSNGGYTGWLLGPAVIGGLGEFLGLSVAMWTIPLLAFLAALMAPLGLRSLPRR